METKTDVRFGKLRSFFWPIHRHELPRVLPMFALFFLISFVFNLLRCMKISMAVTADGAGAEIVSFLKLGGVLPGAILMTWLVTSLMSRFKAEHVFYMMVSGFMLYFLLFVTVLFPNHSLIRLDGIADALQATVLAAPGLKGLVAAIRHLNISIFYVLCDLWSAIVLSMLFWGYANEITKVEDAKRYYPIFALGANFSGIFSGLFAQMVKRMPDIPYLEFLGDNQWVVIQLSLVLLIGALIMSIFYRLNRTVACIDEVEVEGDKVRGVKKKVRYGIIDSLKYMWESKYLAYIVTIVVSYHLVYNLADVMWAHKVKALYSNGGDYNAYINQITMITGAIAVTFGYLLSGNVIRRYGWTVTALLTPILWLFASSGFYGGMIFEGTMLMDIVTTFFANPANMILLIGSTQIIIGRAFKYTIWDETKEIAFIPMTKEHKRKGKAVADGLASRFGKSGGSMVYMILLLFVGDIAGVVPYISVINLVVVGLWIYCVLKLGRLLNMSVLKGHEVDEKIEHGAPFKPMKVKTAQ